MKRLGLLDRNTGMSHLNRPYINDADDIIDIRIDRVFKAVFTRNTQESRGALSKLISALICREVRIETISDNEPPVDDLRERQIRFDINCKALTGELINVEMSLNPSPFEPIRLEYYGGKLFTGQGIRGEGKNYIHLNQVYQIAILAKEKFFDDRVFIHTFEYYDPVNGISLNGKTKIITLELSKLNKIVEKPIKETSSQERWALFFEYLTVKEKRGKINEVIEQEEGIAMASKEVIKFSKDEIERARLISEEKYELDTRTRIYVAKLEGERKGVRKGERKGERKIIDLLKSGKSPEEIISEYEKVIRDK